MLILNHEKESNKGEPNGPILLKAKNTQLMKYI